VCRIAAFKLRNGEQFTPDHFRCSKRFLFSFSVMEISLLIFGEANFRFIAILSPFLMVDQLSASLSTILIGRPADFRASPSGEFVPG
jgi:hypothetical protein